MHVCVVQPPLPSQRGASNLEVSSPYLFVLFFAFYSFSRNIIVSILMVAIRNKESLCEQFKQCFIEMMHVTLVTKKSLSPLARVTIYSVRNGM